MVCASLLDISVRASCDPASRMYCLMLVCTTEDSGLDLCAGRSQAKPALVGQCATQMCGVDVDVRPFRDARPALTGANGVMEPDTPREHSWSRRPTAPRRLTPGRRPMLQV